MAILVHFQSEFHWDSLAIRIDLERMEDGFKPISYQLAIGSVQAQIVAVWHRQF
jgi:hypothetical protein